MCAKARNPVGVFLVLSIPFLWSGTAPRIAGAQEPAVGPLFSIAATAQEEMSISAAFDGTNFLVGIQGDANAHYNIGARRVGPDGSLIGGLIATGRTGGAPYVAFDSGNYLMVWTDDATSPNDDIYGQLISTSGTLVGSAFPISTDAGEQGILGVAFNGSNFLVIWRSDGAPDDLYGRLVSPSGSLVGSRLAIGDRSGPTAASVASDGQHFLVVWQRYTFEDGDPHDIVGRIVSNDGSLGSPFLINVSRSPSYNPVAVAYNGSHYLVAWNHDAGAGYPNPTLWDVLGRRVGTDGSVLGGELTLASGAGDQVVLPGGLASDGDGFFLTWFSFVSEDMTAADVYGRFLDASGATLGSAALIAWGSGGQMGCGVSYGSGRYLCVVNDDVAGFDQLGDVIGGFVPPPSSDGRSAVYRFWSPAYLHHFYTISATERDYVINTWPNAWTYEGVVYYAYPGNLQPEGTSPVFRFWSNTFGGHFYTISATERDYVISTWPEAWSYEGIVYYAYPAGSQPAGTSPVHRFWSDTLGGHFYTISEAEKDYILATWPETWAYEGIAWYAYE